MDQYKEGDGAQLESQKVVKLNMDYCNSDCPNHYSSLDFDSFDFPIFDWSICHGILLKVGDNVKLTDSESVLKSELSKVGYVWEEEMKDMLGKVYEVLSGTNDIVVALNSPNGEQNGIFQNLQFPVIQKLEQEDTLVTFNVVNA